MRESPNYTKEKRFVLKKHPDAWVFDDGEGVGIYLPEERKSPCGECGRLWKRKVRVDNSSLCLGRAGSEPYAWIQAAQGLGFKTKINVVV